MRIVLKDILRIITYNDYNNYFGLLALEEKYHDSRVRHYVIAGQPVIGNPWVVFEMYFSLKIKAGSPGHFLKNRV